MSVSFTIAGAPEDFEGDMNLSNVNARAILEYLGVDNPELYGDMRSFELRNLCMKAIERLLINGDKGVKTTVQKFEDGPLVIDYGRPEGYMIRRIKQLYDLTLKAGDIGVICWG
jgi:hypothetical protein